MLPSSLAERVLAGSFVFTLICFGLVAIKMVEPHRGDDHPIAVA
jgi:hypothetical protein